MLVKINKFDLVIEVIAAVCMIAVTVFLITHWNHLPDSIPGHYDAIGQIDKMTDKNSLIGLHAVAWIMYGVFTAVCFLPQIWNTGFTITEENKEMVYRLLKHMLVMLKLALVLIFSYLTIYSTTGKNLPSLFMLISMLMVFGNMAFWFIKIYIENRIFKNK